jgi:hypothetical protein
MSPGAGAAGRGREVSSTLLLLAELQKSEEQNRVQEASSIPEGWECMETAWEFFCPTLLQPLLPTMSNFYPTSMSSSVS